MLKPAAIALVGIYQNVLGRVDNTICQGTIPDGSVNGEAGIAAPD